MARRAGRFVRLLVLFGALLGLGVAVLALAEFSSPEVGRALLERVGAATGTRLEAAEFRLSVLRGLSLGDVRAAGTYPGGRYDLTLEGLVFEHRLLPLLAGRLTVDRVRLERPRLVLIEAAGPSRSPARPPAEATAAGAAAVALRVVEAVVEGGKLELRARGRAPVVVDGLDVRLHDLSLGPGQGGALGRLSGRGEIRVEDMWLPVTRAREVEGSLRLSAGRLEADELRFLTDEGRFQARWSADLTRLPFSYTMALEGRPLDLNALAGATGKGGRFGPARLILEGSGVGPEPSGLSGKGRLSLEAGTLPATPLLVAVERVLGLSDLSGARYRPSETPFRIEDARVFFEGFRLDSDAMTLEASGWSGLEGALDLRVAVRTPRKSVRIAEVAPTVLDALTDEQGWVRIPLRVTGTRAAPRVSPDAAALLADARRAAGKGLAGRAVEKFKGIFRRR